MTLAVRIEAELERALEAVARLEGRTKSDVVRDALRRYLESRTLIKEARRQSLLVSEGDEEDEILRFIEHATELPPEP